MATKKVVEEVAEPIVDDSMSFGYEVKEATEETRGLLVARKIRVLRDRVKEISPSKMEAGRQKYNYLSEREMTNTLRPVMQELGLVDVCVYTNIHTHPHVLPAKDNNGETMKSVLLTEVEKTYRVYDVESGDFVDFCCVGSGSDTMDKGCNKAVTGARKNFLKDLGNFPSPEREDPDTTPSNGYSSGKSSNTTNYGAIVLKYGTHAGKTIQDLFDENPEEVEKIANSVDKSGNPTWLAKQASSFLNSLK